MLPQQLQPRHQHAVQLWKRLLRKPASIMLLDDDNGCDDIGEDLPWHLLHPDPNDFSERVLVPVVLGFKLNFQLNQE